MAQRANEQRRFSLSVLGFPWMSEDEASERLAGVFGIGSERALRYVREVPARIAEGLSMAQLDVHVIMLHDMGAEVRVVEEPGPGSWTVPASRDPDAPIDREKLCRWHRSVQPARLRGRRRAPPSIGAAKQVSSEREIEPDIETEPDVQTEPDIETEPEPATEGESESQAEPPPRAISPAEPPKRAQPQDDGGGGGEPSHLEIETFAPPELDGERSVWVDRMATSEFFLRGLDERKLRRKALQSGRKRRKRTSFKASEVAKRREAFRERVAKGTIVFSIVLGAFLLANALLPAGPEDLAHRSEVGLFTASLPEGFVDLESRTGLWESPLGDMPYSAHSARNRHDDLGALTFNVLDPPDFITDRWSPAELVRSAMGAAITAQQGRLVETRRIHLDGRDGLEGEYRVNRFGSTFVGRIWVFEVRGDLALLLCEGSGSACLHDPRSDRFFESFSVELNDG